MAAATTHAGGMPPLAVAGAVVEPAGAPQSLQNLAPAANSAPQDAQTRAASDAPHAWQNLPDAGSPQRGQVVRSGESVMVERYHAGADGSRRSRLPESRPGPIF